MRLHYFFLLLFSLVLSLNAGAQTINISNGTVNACGGSFQDDNSGGSEGAPYSDTNYTFTICPDSPGDVIQIEFVAFQLATSPNPNNSDYITIYDGDNTGAPSLGSYTGGTLQGLPVTATINNSSGCLTFVFNPNLANGAPGWEGLISCTTPCDPPSSSSIIQDPAPLGAIQTINACVGDEITFADNGSTAGSGFTLETYQWNFDDGSIDTLSGQVVSHSFTEPGEYVVTLTVLDNNGCTSLNLEPLQVLVSTSPILSVDWDEQICLGAEAELSCEPESVTWTALPPQVVAGETYLADGAGFSYSTSLVFDFFEPGAVLEDCADFEELFVNMEHSYLGDLQLQITCPNGTVVNLLEWPNGGGGTYLGEAVDDGSTIAGTGYDYTWTPTATNPPLDDPSNWTQITYVNNAGQNVTANTVPSGTYSSQEDLCNLVGCPLNGEWTLTVIDNLAIDNGYIFEWGLTFNPYLYPGITTFTPIIGMGPDSTYWEGPFVSSSSVNGNSITVLPDAAGTYDYTFFATNNFGCSFDTTVSVTVNAMPDPIVEDLELCAGEIGQFELTLDGEVLPSCSGDAGNYTYCYSSNDNTTFTYCPDDQGDGVTFIDISFTAGTMENFFDFINIYDGPNTGSPLLGSLNGTGIAGETFIATGATGCLTIQFTSDGSVSCQDGFFDPVEYTVGCSLGGPAYEVLWSPGTGLSSTTVAQPTVEGAPSGTTYTIEVYPMGFPECASSTQATVFFGEDVDAGESTVEEFCGSYGNVVLFDLLGGNPNSGGIWTNSEGEEVSGLFVTTTDEPDTFTYTVADAGCEEFSTVEILINEITITASADTTVCINGTATLSANPVGNPPQEITYHWSGTAGDFTGQEIAFTPTSNPTLMQVYGSFDGNCETNAEQVLVEMYSPLSMNVMTDVTVCLEDSLDLQATNISGGLPPYLFTWEGDNGETVLGNPAPVQLEQETTYCLTLTDACETPPDLGCVTVSLEELINPTFTASPTEGCNPITVNFFGNATNPEIISSVVWDFGDGAVGNTVNVASHTYMDPGQYDVSLTITSIQGCVYDSIAPQFVYSYPVPDAGFSPSPQTVFLPNTSFEFINQSFGQLQNEWTFGPYGFSNELNPEFTFPVNQITTIDVELIVTNAFGCKDTVERTVFIQEDFVLYIPNAFTPDNDGLNDFFFVTGQDVNTDDYHIQIFDRWGELVWESKDFFQPWDGSLNNGDYYVQDGVYVWRIETRSLSTAEKKSLSGHITLLR